MRIVICFLLCIGLLSCNNDDNMDSVILENIFVGDVYLKTQTEVDVFTAEGYTKIEGSLLFNWDLSVGNDDILDLSGFEDLTEILGRLYMVDVPYLESLNGLHNIFHVGGLILSNNGGLTNLDGLSGLTTVEDEENILNLEVNGRDIVYIGSHTRLTSLNGLSNLSSVSSLEIVANYSINGTGGLESLEGLNNLQTLTGTRVYDTNGDLIEIRKYITIGTVGGGPSGGNIYLYDLCALQNLFINGDYDPNDVSIVSNSYNPSVQDIIDGNCSG